VGSQRHALARSDVEDERQLQREYRPDHQLQLGPGAVRDGVYDPGMDWKEFWASVVNSLAWPVTLGFVAYLLREPLRRLLGQLRRVRYRDAEAEFGAAVQEAEISAEQAELPALAAPNASEPALFTELSAEILTAPRAAVIAAWLAVERELNVLASRSGIDVAERTWTPEALAGELWRQGVIDQALASVIGDLRDARNVAAHAAPYTVEPEAVVDYVKLAGRVRTALRMAGQSQDAAREGRTSYDLLVYHDLADPTERTGGTIPSVGDDAEALFGELGRNRRVVAVGPGIHERRVAVVLAHSHGPMPEMQALLDRQAAE
jgi:hypothetical protein